MCAYNGHPQSPRPCVIKKQPVCTPGHRALSASKPRRAQGRSGTAGLRGGKAISRSDFPRVRKPLGLASGLRGSMLCSQPLHPRQCLAPRWPFDSPFGIPPPSERIPWCAIQIYRDDPHGLSRQGLPPHSTTFQYPIPGPSPQAIRPFGVLRPRKAQGYSKRYGEDRGWGTLQERSEVWSSNCRVTPPGFSCFPHHHPCPHCL